jgi:ubiquitin-protein ligase
MSKALKFLSRQYKQLLKNPLPNVEASPIGDDNFLCWHGTIFFPESHEFFPGLPIHFEMTFTDQYPNISPQLKLQNSLDHSHVRWRSPHPSRQVK